MRKSLDFMDNTSDDKSINTNKKNAAPPTTKGIFSLVVKGEIQTMQ